MPLRRERLISLKYLADKYIRDVVGGKIVVCKWVRLCVERHLRDLDDVKCGRRTDIRFDRKAAGRVIDFFKFLRHFKGEWAGEMFVLQPWQQFILWVVFGWKIKVEGFWVRRFRTVYLEEGRKNGKSTMLAGVGLYLFLADDEPGAEIFTVATKRDQAIIVHNAATNMVKASPSLRKKITVYKNNLSIALTNSKYEPLGADANTMDGLNPHAVIIDELHAHKSGEVWDIMETATGARRQPLQFAITTAGYDRESICWEQHEYVEKILKGVIEDDSYFGIIFTLDEGDEWDDEKCWIKANPNLGVSVKLDKMRNDCKKAQELPSRQNTFKRKHLNLWTANETKWLDSVLWDRCGAKKLNRYDLEGRKCYGGLDLASSIATASFALVFPPEKEGERFKFLFRFWIPEDNMVERCKRDRVPYDVWCDQGWMTATPGNVIDYAHIIYAIQEDAEFFDLAEIAYDPWGSTKIMQDLQGLGFEDPIENKHAARRLIRFRQGYGSLSGPSKEFEKMILSGQFEHEGNPVMRWMIDNVIIKMDPSGNIKPDKSKSRLMIDGVVAGVMALARGLEGHGGRSVYEERGVLTFG